MITTSVDDIVIRGDPPILRDRILQIIIRVTHVVCRGGEVEAFGGLKSFMGEGVGESFPAPPSLLLVL